jgi:hypothetical protein
VCYSLTECLIDANKCPARNFFDRIKKKCAPCGKNCDICTAKDKCTKCTNPFSSDGKGGCECGDGTFNSGDTCENCRVPQCVKCSSADTCDVCAAGWTLGDDKKCYNTNCPAKTFFSTQKKTCVNCSPLCDVCANEKTCITCSEGTTLAADGQCYD